MRSILSNDEQCWVCGDTTELHRHHVYGGVSNRKNSEYWGCWVYLCPIHHNMSNKGVHFNHDLDTLLKKTTQRAWEMKAEFVYRERTREEFRKVFGKSYL